ncbi:hypothetical protein Gpo141_00014355, partial [Globisporangium polare]
MDVYSHAMTDSLMPLDAFPVSLDKQAALDVITTRPGGEKLLDLTFLHAISTTATGKKRTLSLSHDDGEEGEDDGATSPDGSDATETPQVPKATAAAKKKKNKGTPTHVLRR